MTLKMEAVTYALRWITSRGDNQSTHAIILTESMSLLQKVNSGMESPDWHVSVFDIHLRGCTVLDMPESKEMTEQIDWLANQPSQAGCVSEDLKC